MTGPYQLLGRAEGTAECAVTGAMPALFLNKCAAADVFLRFAEPVDETELRVITTPGHTRGGVCFLCEKDAILFTGDTLFAGSIGRTDHPGGDYDQLIDSIDRKLMPLDGDITILPGHGTPSSIGYERATNPFLQPA